MSSAYIIIVISTFGVCWRQFIPFILEDLLKNQDNISRERFSIQWDHYQEISSSLEAARPGVYMFKPFGSSAVETSANI